MRRVLPLLLCSAATAAAGPAVAQDDQRGVPVQERARPDYDPINIRVGSFLLAPEASLIQEYNDNVFAEDTDTDADLITVVAPRVELSSDWSRHALSLDAGAEVGRYWDNTDENYVDYGIGADGRLDVLRETFVTGGLRYQHLHEDRGDPNATAAALEPVQYELLTGNITGFRGLGRTSARVFGNFRSYDFDTVPLQGGGTSNDDLRDRNEYEAGARFSYELVPDVVPFVQAAYNWRRYDRVGAVDRDSSGYRAEIGTTLDFGGVTTGEIFAGYLRQDYDAAQLESVDGISFGGSVLWSLTALTSVQVALARTVEETSSANASSFLSTVGSVRVDHELRRNVLLNGRVSYGQDDYQGIDREVDVLEAGAGVRYLVNRNLSAGLGYTYKDKNVDGANGATGDYTQNVILLSVTGRL
ncbi:outer membrane beta-barrel protein [Arenibaculum sp.]|jgi:hypothetical protein|uniref:outer membrane beta-barrel protein n=1 Tax=Arenibaculum sp. TaxID=2865862 RepID=UPI002E1287F1|nr:outer membrane beta-barrel protein [Arenibaculum sp.]